MTHRGVLSEHIQNLPQTSQSCSLIKCPGRNILRANAIVVVLIEFQLSTTLSQFGSLVTPYETCRPLSHDGQGVGRTGSFTPPAYLS